MAEDKKTAIEPFSSLDEGTEIRFRGMERDGNGDPVGEVLDITLTVPPMNLYNMKRYAAQFHALGDAAPQAYMEALVEILLAALSQNYKGVPKWLVEQSINQNSAPKMAMALASVNGLIGRDPDAGKAKATEALIGTGSTAT